MRRCFRIGFPAVESGDCRGSGNEPSPSQQRFERIAASLGTWRAVAQSKSRASAEKPWHGLPFSVLPQRVRELSLLPIFLALRPR
jgi:hypothetical protein